MESASEPPPLDVGEALEDAANEYLNLFDAISAQYRNAPEDQISR